jgi:lipopolysaccharide export system protein LptA
MWRMIPALLGLLFLAQPLGAQSETTISFGGMRGDPTLPVNVTAQSLTVDEGKGSAVFAGEVLVVQGQMRLQADEVRVTYSADSSRIDRLWATGNVVLVNAEDAASADSAEYVIDTGLVEMQGNVVLTQGAATFTAERFSTDLTKGVGRLDGGVSVSFTPGAGGGSAP